MSILNNKLTRGNFKKLLILSVCSGLLIIGLLFNQSQASDPPGGGGWSSVSGGTAWEGWIENAVYLDDDYYYDVYWYDNQRWGCDFILYDATHAALEWYADYQWQYGGVSFGPISLQYGGDMPGSSSHEDGTCFDLRYIGNNGGPCSIWDQCYNMEGSFAWIALLNTHRTIAGVITGDLELAYWLDLYGFPVTLDTSGVHDNHIHARFVK